MAKKLIFPLVFILIMSLFSCSKQEDKPSPTAPHEVDVLRLDTPTPAPTPKQEQVTVYSELSQVSALLDYSRWYVQPVLPIRSGWGEAENITAEELGRFFTSLGDERRGYAISEYLSEDEYVVPSERFCTTISSYFSLSDEYLMGLASYDTETDSFVFSSDAADIGFAEVYRVEDRSDELRIRYLLYSDRGGYRESTGSRYELCVGVGGDYAHYISSAPVVDDQTLPAPQNGQSYINTEINDLYARRALTVDETTGHGDILLIRFSGAWSGLELFDRTSGETTPVVDFVTDESLRSMLVSAPFDEFATARLGAYSLEEDGSVRLLVQNLASESAGSIFARVYTFKDGAFSYESYSAPLGSTAIVGAGGRGRLYGIVPGRSDRLALMFSADAMPTIRVSRSAGTLTIRMSGVSLDDDYELPTSLSPYYSLASVTQAGEDTVLALSLSNDVTRYRLHIYDPIAGGLPYIELELVTGDVDYPEGW